MLSLLFVFIPLAAELAAISIISAYLNRLTFARFGSRPYFFFMFPGVVVHELAHYLGCIMTRTKVYKVKLFEPNREGRAIVLGYVEHEKPRNAVIGLIIGAAPFFLGSAVLWGMARVWLPQMTAAFSGAVFALNANLIDAVMRVDWRSGWTYVFLYVVVGVSAHLAPSSTDMKNAFGGLLIILAMLAAVVGIGYGFHLFGPESVAIALSRPIGAVAAILAYGVAGGIVATAALHILAIGASIVRRIAALPRRLLRHSRKKR